MNKGLNKGNLAETQATSARRPIKFVLGGIAALIVLLTGMMYLAAPAGAATGSYANEPLIDSAFAHDNFSVGANNSAGPMTWSVSGNWRKPVNAWLVINRLVVNDDGLIVEERLPDSRLSGGFNLTDSVVIQRFGGAVWLPAATPGTDPGFNLTVVNPAANETFVARVQTLTTDEVLYWSGGADIANAVLANYGSGR